MTNREAFLGRVRQAAQMGRAYRVHSPQFPPDVGYVGAGDNLVRRFCEEATAVGGQTFVVRDVPTAKATLSELLLAAGAKSAVTWQHEVLDRIGLNRLLTDAGIEAFDFTRLSGLADPERRAMLLTCDVGITSCEAAVAETGTLMMCSRPGRERLASLIAPRHIAVIERKQLVPDLIDAFRLLRAEKDARTPYQTAQELPSNVTFITGPSKTGDIELQLTTGVHGPGIWQLILIDDPSPV